MLKIFSQVLDEGMAKGNPPPRRILDAGCGMGVIGICAAKNFAQSKAQSMAQGTAPENAGLQVRAQDRDELARLITLHNAAKNGILSPLLEAYTEPLLAAPPEIRWDFILSNIPAKAGTPVLEDFVSRSTALLSPGGKAIIVAVHTLADFFRGHIADSGAELLLEHKGPGHHVFVYGKGKKNKEQLINNSCDSEFFTQYPFYIRTNVTAKIEGIAVQLETIHGAAGFDDPGGAVHAMAKLAARLAPLQLNANDAILIHEGGQGFFPCWLLQYLHRNHQSPQQCPPLPAPHSPILVLSGRNILALESARHNVMRNNNITPLLAPAVDLSPGNAALTEAASGRQYCIIAAFPELLPPSALPKGIDQLAALWDSLPPLLSQGGFFLAAFGSSEAERFDRKKPPGFTRLGCVKRGGFRALAYRYNV